MINLHEQAAVLPLRDSDLFEFIRGPLADAHGGAS